MSQWLVAQVVSSRHTYAASHIRRVGYEVFYPMWRRIYGKSREVQTGALYPGYMFVRSPHMWYSILESSTAVLGIVARPSDREPLRSKSLDDRVEKLIESQDTDGFVPWPRPRSKFLRGDRVSIYSKMFSGVGTVIRLRNDRVEVAADGSQFPISVREDEVYA